MSKTAILCCLALSAESAVIVFKGASDNTYISVGDLGLSLNATNQTLPTQTNLSSTSVAQVVTDTPIPTSFSSSVAQVITNIPTTTSSFQLPSPAPVQSTESSSGSEPTSSSNTPEPTSNWVVPDNMENLVSFNITYFPAGIQNMAIVSGIPASASATEAAIKAVETGSTAPPWDNSTSVLQLLYPANSINPGNQPQGGAEFYAQPIDMASANKVALEYSVFFPADFNFVLGGKLPGMYGGHVTCSGGNNAKSCFSTRLMWRSGGVGELYLYAPKDKQTKALCSHPQSVCDATYGFSVGRGSFIWVKGGWTHIRQTVGLNTPGETDGTFALEVNGDQVINRDDVFYRDVAAASKPNNGKNTDKPAPAPAPPAPAPSKSPKPSPDAGGLLGPIIGGLFGSQEAEDVDPVDVDLDIRPQSIMELDESDEGPEDDDDMASSDGSMESPSVYLHEAQEAKPGQPVGFIGLFFSTFFGGHDEKYATPRDQYVWFKDFAMAAE